MNSAWWTRAAAVITVLGALGAGCQVSVETTGSGSDCPTATPSSGASCDAAGARCAYPDGPCTMAFACGAVDHTWTLDGSTCTPAAVDCWAAQQGDLCAIPGDSCGEGDGPCGQGFVTRCGADHRWQVDTSIGDACCGDLGACPAAPPSEGEACDPCNQPQYCNYADGCGGTTASCGPDAVWHIIVEDCPPPPPPDTCGAHADFAGCTAAPECRWLTPGCGGPALPTAGCFAAVNCNPGGCAPGLSCQEVLVDPCFNMGCDVCVSDVSVCLP
jgi:hypothetical protein